MFLKVKGVPAIYLPIMYYPLSKENRNTGFLMPSYGSSSYKGQTISNAFFWAIGRSQDATFLHDWFSKTGQAVAGEYRYVSLGGSGNLRTDFLNEHPITFIGTDGDEVEQPGRRSFRTYGNLSQSLGGSWYAQGRADYSSDLTVDQLYDTDIARATRRTQELRRIGERHDQGHPLHRHLRSQRVFRRKLDLVAARNLAAHQHCPAGSPSAGIADLRIGELGIRAHRAETVRRVARTWNRNDSLDRFDIVPAVRFPFNKLAFLTFNTTAQFRNTFWTAQHARGHRRTGWRCRGQTQPLLDAPISRRFVELSADVNGPDAGENLGRAEERVRAALPSLDRAVRPGALSHGDRQLQRHPQDRKHGQHRRKRDVVHIRHEHALLRQAHRRRPARDSARGHQRHRFRQTYNTDARSVLSDADQRSRNIEPTSHFTPVQVLVRTSPFDGVTGTFRTDYDGRYSRFRSFSADAGWEQERISHIASWSNVRFRPDILGQKRGAADPLFQLVHELAVSAEPLRRHALAQLGRQEPVVDAAPNRHLLQRAVLRLLRRVPVHRPQPDQQHRASSRTRDFTFPSRSAASATFRTSSARWAAPATGDPASRASTPPAELF